MEEWHPTWWDPTHLSTWDRIKEAMKRDWEQTKHDLGMKSGHYLNQSVSDTVRQASGSEPLPGPEQTNPPKVLGDWNDIELPVGYGYAARNRPGASGTWSDEVNTSLQSEWDSGPTKPSRPWSEVWPYVRHGYEYPRQP